MLIIPLRSQRTTFWIGAALHGMAVAAVVLSQQITMLTVTATVCVLISAIQFFHATAHSFELRFLRFKDGISQVLIQDCWVQVELTLLFHNSYLLALKFSKVKNGGETGRRLGQVWLYPNSLKSAEHRRLRRTLKLG